MRKTDIIIIAALCVVLLGGAVTAIVLVNQPSERPTSIVATLTQPTRTYARGERIENDHIRVTAMFKSGAREVTGFSLNTREATNGGVVGNTEEKEQEITITFRGQSTKIKITVGAAVIRRMDLVSRPTKTVYRVGEAFVSAGFTARLVWTDHNETLSNTDVVFTNTSTSTTGLKIVTATHTASERFVTFDIIVNP